MLIAWLGAAAFAGSLAYLVYFYAVTLGSSDGRHDVVSAATINLALFTAFALHHSLFARAGVKRLVTRVVPAALERPLYVWIASSLVVAMCGLWQPIAGLAYAATGWRALPFWLLQGAAALLVARAARVIDPLELAGIRQVAVDRGGTGSLQVRGPFRVIRHPIYLGWVLLVFGTPAMTANRLVFAVISTLYLILAIPWEEKSLVAVHGDQYRAYQRSVRWRLVPGVW